MVYVAKKKTKSHINRTRCMFSNAATLIRCWITLKVGDNKKQKWLKTIDNRPVPGLLKLQSSCICHLVFTVNAMLILPEIIFMNTRNACCAFCTDALLERVKCSNPECNNYEARLWLDEKGQCMKCQRKHIKEKALSGQMDLLNWPTNWNHYISISSFSFQIPVFAK